MFIVFLHCNVLNHTILIQAEFISIAILINVNEKIFF